MPRKKEMTNEYAPPDERFKRTFFLVEATAFERRMLWSEWAKELEWVDEPIGWLHTIGMFARCPVVLSFTWSSIGGQLVVFWEPTSQVVDYRMIDLWLAKYCPTLQKNGSANTRCDAENFGSCIRAIHAANAAAA